MRGIRLRNKNEEVIEKLYDAAFDNNLAISSVRDGVYVVPREVVNQLEPDWYEWVDLTSEEQERFRLLQMLSIA